MQIELNINKALLLEGLSEDNNSHDGVPLDTTSKALRKVKEYSTHDTVDVNGTAVPLDDKSQAIKDIMDNLKDN